VHFPINRLVRRSYGVGGSSFFSANGRIRRGELLNFSFILSLPAFHPKKFGDFIGTYELAPGQTRSVTAEGEKLFVERKGKKEELNKEKQLFPETSDLFFRKGVEGRILFHYDATGKVESLIDRRICLKFTRRRRAIRPVTSHSATQLPPCSPRSSVCILPCYALRICWIRFSAI
jgi:hypothetical protein